MLAIVRGRTLLILEVKGQGHNWQACEHDRDLNVVCLFIELDKHVNHGERMNSIDFGGYMSKVKVMMGIIDKCGVRGDATLCIAIFDFWFIFEFIFMQYYCQ